MWTGDIRPCSYSQVQHPSPLTGGSRAQRMNGPCGFKVVRLFRCTRVCLTTYRRCPGPASYCPPVHEVHHSDPVRPQRRSDGHAGSANVCAMSVFAADAAHDECPVPRANPKAQYISGPVARPRRKRLIRRSCRKLSALTSGRQSTDQLYRLPVGVQPPIH